MHHICATVRLRGMREKMRSSNGRERSNPLTPEDFHVFEWFSAFTRPIGFSDSIFKDTIESAAVLKH